MRLFVAVDLDDTARAAAADLADRLTQALAGGPAARQVSWVQPANMHLTMRFIGAASDEMTNRIRAALEPPLATRAFDARFSGAGTFPGSLFPRVLWLGVDEGAAPLGDAAAETENRVQEAGVEPETRPFSAHVTLARIPRPDRRVGVAIQRALDATSFTPVAWRVDHLTLYESRLSPEGSTYLPVMRVMLGTEERA